jgi:hypothetical protein
VREPFPADEVEEFHAIRQNPVGIGGRQCCRIGPESEEGRGRVLGAWHPTGLVVGHDVCARGVVEPVDPAADRHAVTPALARVEPIEQLDGSVGSVPDHLRERRTLLP